MNKQRLEYATPTSIIKKQTELLFSDYIKHTHNALYTMPVKSRYSL